MGSEVMAIGCLSVSWSARALFGWSVRLGISQWRHISIFWNFSWSRVNKLEKWHKINFEKNLNLGIKGDYVSKIVVLEIFQKLVIKSFLIFLHELEGNKMHHLSMVGYLDKILIRD